MKHNNNVVSLFTALSASLLLAHGAFAAVPPSRRQRSRPP